MENASIRCLLHAGAWSFHSHRVAMIGSVARPRWAGFLLLCLLPAVAVQPLCAVDSGAENSDPPGVPATALHPRLGVGSLDLGPYDA